MRYPHSAYSLYIWRDLKALRDDEATDEKSRVPESPPGGKAQACQEHPC